jgi:hypothetical protein
MIMSNLLIDFEPRPDLAGGDDGPAPAWLEFGFSTLQYPCRLPPLSRCLSRGGVVHILWMQCGIANT